jgi:hypothetical protein
MRKTCMRKARQAFMERRKPVFTGTDPMTAQRAVRARNFDES